MEMYLVGNRLVKTGQMPTKPVYSVLICALKQLHFSLMEVDFLAVSKFNRSGMNFCHV